MAQFQVSVGDVSLAEVAARYALDPYGFVMAMFPWGEGELVDYGLGPHEWQVRVLEEIGLGLAGGEEMGVVVREAVASGHGVGKSALMSWLMLWGVSTCVDCRGVVTANTETQLRTKTWPELAKWRRLCLVGRWLDYTATSLSVKDGEHPDWRIDAVPWSETRTEAFAGLHNAGKRILLLMDEASAVPDVIWEVAEGALTDLRTQIIWCAFGNPTRNSGRFRECFGRLSHRWKVQQVDSRLVPGVNIEQVKAWVEDYGEDSDFVRVRVRGVFPRSGTMQLIGGDLVDAAVRRERSSSPYDPLVLGVDIARFGDDRTVLSFRRGLDARELPSVVMRGVDTMGVAGRVAQEIEDKRVDACFVDEGGVGAGVLDRLRQLGHRPIGVNFGSKPDGGVGGLEVRNKAAEMWVRVRDWLRDGGCLPDDRDLCGELTAREYGYDGLNKIVMEKKDDMKKRGLASCDLADALALTFAHPVAPRDRHALEKGVTPHAAHEWDPIASAFSD